MSQLPVHKALPSADIPKQVILPSWEFWRDPRFKTTCNQMKKQVYLVLLIKVSLCTTTKIQVQISVKRKQCQNIMLWLDVTRQNSILFLFRLLFLKNMASLQSLRFYINKKNPQWERYQFSLQNINSFYWPAKQSFRQWLETETPSNSRSQ